MFLASHRFSLNAMYNRSYEYRRQSRIINTRVSINWFVKSIRLVLGRLDMTFLFLIFFFILFNRVDACRSVSCSTNECVRYRCFFGITALFRGPSARQVDVTKPPVAVCVTTLRNWQQMGSANGL